MFLARPAAPTLMTRATLGVPFDRLACIDNLRVFLIALVVTFHAASTYSGQADWYWFDAGRTGAKTRLLLTTYLMCLHSFLTSLLFLIAGYFTRLGCDRKGERRFLRDRALRLGLPVLFYALVVHPLMTHFVLRWDDGPFRWFYRHYLTSLSFVGGFGPLWFLPVLLVFSCAYVAIRLAGARLRVGSVVPGWWPAGLLAGMVLLTFLMRFPFPWDGSVARQFLGSVPQYVLMFGVGILAAPRGWLQRVPAGLGYRASALFAVLGPPGALALIALDAAAGVPGAHPVLGGGTWQSLVYAAWESVLCLAGSLGLLVLFREHLHRETRLSRRLARASFGVYLLHGPILVAASLDIYPWMAPPLLKCATLSLITLVVAFGIVQLLRGFPPLRRVL